MPFLDAARGRRARAARVLCLDLRRLHGRVRPDRQDPRRPADQARRQSRSPGLAWRPVRGRPGLHPRPLRQPAARRPDAAGPARVVGRCRRRHRRRARAGQGRPARRAVADAARSRAPRCARRSTGSSPRFPTPGTWSYDALSASAVLDAHERTHGARVLPRYRFDRAAVIVSVDADFLGTWISPVEYTAGYRAGRSAGRFARAPVVPCPGRVADVADRREGRPARWWWRRGEYGPMLAHLGNRVARLAGVAAAGRSAGRVAGGRGRDRRPRRPAVARARSGAWWCAAATT